MALTDLVLIGGGGHASDLLGVIEACNRAEHRYDVRALFDDNAERRRFEGRNVEIRGDVRTAEIGDELLACRYLAAVGYPTTRAGVVEQARQLGLHPADPIIHPGAVYVGTGVELGKGTIVHAGVSLSVSAHVGDHCYLSHGALIGHDSEIGDCCSIMPGATLSGEVTIGRGAMIGSGAVLLEGVSVGEWSQVGANAVVTHDVEAGATVLGVPARPR